MQLYKHPSPFVTETGSIINGLEIAYHTYGTYNRERNNVVWICHALTANSDAADWWPGMVGEGKFYDPEKYFIICANVLGSCYGTTGPLSINPDTGRQYLHDFPEITIRDIVRANDLLREHLQIERIHTVIGGSIGGFQSMEWAIMKPMLFDHVVLIACSAKASPWVIAFNESQRLALMADSSFAEGFMNKGNSNYPARETDGREGLKAARSIALISYRTSEAYNLTQSGITTDILYPVHEQKHLATLFPNAVYKEIYSDFGHDGFLIEDDQLMEVLKSVAINYSSSTYA